MLTIATQNCPWVDVGNLGSLQAYNDLNELAVKEIKMC